MKSLTNEIERGAEAILARIAAAGGTLAAIETGLIQREIQESAYRAQLAIDAGTAVVVGVNTFAVEPPAASAGALRRRPRRRAAADRARARGPRQPERQRVRRRRSPPSAHAARDGSNLVPPIIAAVEAKATVGEIADAMRDVFGEFKETATL